MTQLQKKYKNHSVEEISRDFLKACTIGDFKTVKHLSAYSIHEINGNLKSPNNTALTQACTNGHLNIVKHLITSSDMIRHKNVKADLGLGFISAALNGHVNIIKFIWESSLEKDKPFLRLNGITAFFMALKRNNLELLKYLIYDIDIPRTATMDEFLFIKPNSEVDKLFKLRAINKELNNTLASDKINKTRVKL